MMDTPKCQTCKIRERILKSKEPACCIWSMDNVVCGDKSVDDCPEYKEVSINMIDSLKKLIRNWKNIAFSKKCILLAAAIDIIVFLVYIAIIIAGIIFILMLLKVM